jgi:hypothetical protein
MIVGRGLIATAFKNSLFDSSAFVVFASGVSNSTESDPEAYARELALLDPYLSKSTTLIYFSTTSIFDPSKADTPYIRHKQVIENLIRDQAEHYLIVRLPILVGHTSNPYTLINFLANAIRLQRKIHLHAQACRHILDIDDLVPLLTPFAAQPAMQQVINIPGSQKIPVPDLIHKMEFVLGVKGVFAWEETGACYDIPTDAGQTLFIRKPNYLDDVLVKYLHPASS